MQNFSLGGKVAMVTGANTGIGQAIAVALAEAGADIVVVGRSSCRDTVDLIQPMGRRVLELNADLSTTEPLSGLVADAAAGLGQLDILVNNAGIIRREDALNFSEADWDAVIDTNLKSVFFLSQAAARYMVERGSGGKIINIASLLSFQGGIRVASYTAAKSGVAGLTKLLANEWSARGINVNAIAPGYIRTNNTAVLQQEPDRSRAILDRIPAGRWGEASDIGGAAVFMASQAANYIHGVTLPVDGGWLAR